MKHKLIISLLFITGFCESQTIINSSKLEYQKATQSNYLIKDKSVKIYKDKVVLAKNHILKNNYSDEDFFEYKYLGSFGNLYKYIVIEKEDYNGSTFFVVDKEKKYKKYEILGRPHLFQNFIVAVNMEATTDNKNILNLYKVNGNLEFLKKINLPEDIVVKDVKVLDYYIYITDINDKFWKIKFK
jgi:hypothetical protein